MNPFANIISPTFLKTFNNAIDSLLMKNSLAIPCTLYYNNGLSQDYCNNCIYDQITKISSNQYNNTGPVPFADHSICPVCMGMGIVQTNKSTTTIDLAVIFDSKYFVNISNNVINIADGYIQTLCNISHMVQIRSAGSLSINDTEKYGSYSYDRAGDPNPMGLGDTNYIITMWKRK